MMHSGFGWAGDALAASAAAYSVFACLAQSHVAPPAATVDALPPPAPRQPPMTLFKPLCGAEPETYECLRSFCDQDYPAFEIVFGVAEPTDPAIGIVERLRREFSHVPMFLVVDRRQHGSSRKVSNLINMMARARHEFFVLSDSDVRVGRDYLARLAAGGLLDAEVGIVTCPYRGTPRPGLWSQLGAQFINEWFIPSVRVAALGGSRAFAFGVTIALRRRTLARVGGFAAIANQLADDYRLGELTRRLGLRTVLSDVVVETSVIEGSLGELLRHELRWLRTIRAVRPLGYFLAVVTFGVPVAAVGALLAGGTPPALGLLAVTSAARLRLHFAARRSGAPLRETFILPLRDLLTLGLWAWGYAARSVQWRDDRYRVKRDGSVLPAARV